MTTNDTDNTLNYGDSATIKTAQTNSDDTKCNVNVANNVAQPEMQDLTKKWESGKLESGAYYILLATDEIFSDSYNPYGYFEQFDSLVEKVIAPVPSYDELQRLKEENRMLATGSFPMMIEAARKIEKLRQLLKECRHYIVNTPVYPQGDDEKQSEIHKLLDKINAAIGESEE